MWRSRFFFEKSQKKKKEKVLQDEPKPLVLSHLDA